MQKLIAITFTIFLSSCASDGTAGRIDPEEFEKDLYKQTYPNPTRDKVKCTPDYYAQDLC